MALPMIKTLENLIPAISSHLSSSLPFPTFSIIQQDAALLCLASILVGKCLCHTKQCTYESWTGKDETSVHCEAGGKLGRVKTL